VEPVADRHTDAGTAIGGVRVLKGDAVAFVGDADEKAFRTGLD
jgi:hypothetical protein